MGMTKHHHKTPHFLGLASQSVAPGLAALATLESLLEMQTAAHLRPATITCTLQAAEELRSPGAAQAERQGGGACPVAIAMFKTGFRMMARRHHSTSK